MRTAILLLVLAACGATQNSGEQRPASAGDECRGKDDPGVHHWLDAETCKVALVPPCPAGQKFTTDPCGCYCLDVP